MRVLVLTTMLAVAAGCNPVGLLDEVFLTPNEADALVEHFEASVDAQQELSEFVFAATRGDLDLVNDYPNVDYVPPSDLNGWVGSLTITDGIFSFGTGDLMVDFTVSDALGNPVDPYFEDIRDAVNLTIDADVAFDGVSTIGSGLTADGDVTITTLQNTVDDATALIQGTFNIDHGGYLSDISTNDLELTFDMVTEKVTNVAGSISGNVDIPNFAFDADFDVDGLGDRIQVTLDAAATKLSYTLSLLDL
jgi:hypothetical protein